MLLGHAHQNVLAPKLPARGREVFLAGRLTVYKLLRKTSSVRLREAVSDLLWSLSFSVSAAP